MDRGEVIQALEAGGCVAPAEEADALLAASEGGAGSIDALIARRLSGEPLAWITGRTTFCNLRLHVDPGVFVPRPHTQALAMRAAALLPPDGIAVDLCTGCGAVAAVLISTHPRAPVIATDIDAAAVACARRNGVQALAGDLDEPLPRSIQGRVDVLTAVVPYVPTEEMHLLPADTVSHEPQRALDGGPHGTALLIRAVHAAARLLRPGGSVLLELGGDQAVTMSPALASAGFEAIRVHADDEGQDRMIEARRSRVRH